MQGRNPKLHPRGTGHWEAAVWVEGRVSVSRSDEQRHYFGGPRRSHGRILDNAGQRTVDKLIYAFENGAGECFSVGYRTLAVEREKGGVFELRVSGSGACRLDT